jgi:pimeloyl-ACP methyl ester carboxylesterase
MSARQVVALGSAAVGALVALNGVLTPTGRQPAHTMPGETRHFASRFGDVHYTVLGSGPPAVMVHGLGVTASSYEYRYVVEPLARERTVFALDLLGFGQSDHPACSYTAELFIALLGDFLRSEVSVPAMVVAAGLSALYCGAVAADDAGAISSLAICSPIYPDGRAELPAVMRRAADTMLATPILGQSVFNALTARNAIRSYMRDRAYSNADLVTESMIDAQYATAHQPNARRAARSYLAGNAGLDARPFFGRLSQPLLVVVGRDNMTTSLPMISDYVRLVPQAQVRVIERSSLLPHEEQPEQFSRAITSWLAVPSETT